MLTDKMFYFIAGIRYIELNPDPYKSYIEFVTVIT